MILFPLEFPFEMYRIYATFAKKDIYIYFKLEAIIKNFQSGGRHLKLSPKNQRDSGTKEWLQTRQAFQTKGPKCATKRELND